MPNSRRRAMAEHDAVGDGVRPLLGSLATVRGAHACAMRDCQSRAGVRCEYVDRRNRRCPSAWCPEHRALVEAQVLCRRHASVMHALPAPATGEAPGPPDLDSRAASLTNWVADSIDGRVRALLTERRGGSPSAQAVLLHVDGSAQVRTWERAWYRRGSAIDGPRRVAVAVAEGNEDEVILRIDGRDCARLTPPWISRRGLAVDDPARLDFSEGLVTALKVALRASSVPSAP